MFVEEIITLAILISTNRVLLKNIHYFSFNFLKEILKTKFENTNFLKLI